MPGRRSPRLSPWAATFLLIYLTYLHHCEVTPSLSAAVCRRHSTLRGAFSCKLQPRYYITALESCLNSLRTWFCENGMALNPTILVSILFVTPQKLKSLSRLNSVNVAETDIQLSDKLKILGLWHSHFCREHIGFISSLPGKFHTVSCCFEAYRSPSARSESTG